MAERPRPDWLRAYCPGGVDVDRLAEALEDEGHAPDTARRMAEARRQRGVDERRIAAWEDDR
ncbi:MAG: hypothetical protein Q8Q14_12300 [Gemmatimonadales bacterium]|nr:hypothetical protein [Gemmatimonadales bacterium]